MKDLAHFSIPYKGLGDGIHHLSFTADQSLFRHFECKIIDNGTFKIDLELDKRSGHSILDFTINGAIKTDCDRCMESIDLPITGQYIVHLKLTDEEVEENDEIVYFPANSSIINVGKLFYEYILLSVPITKTYDCHLEEKPPCNFDVLAKLEYDEESGEEAIEDDSNPFAALKGIDFED